MTNLENNKSFHPEIPSLQIAWDSTSLGTFKECPRKYYYLMILGRAPRDESVHLTFGAHYHKALEVYDHAKAVGKTHEEAQLEAVRYCYEATVVRFPNGTWRPWMSDMPEKNRFTLMRLVIWYLEQFKDDPLKTVILSNGKPAVELSFRFETDIQVPGQVGEYFWLCGHIDRLVELDGNIHFLDRKTSKHTISPDTFKKFTPDNQMSLYDLATQVVWETPAKGGILDAAQVGATMARFQRGFLPRTKLGRAEWLRDTAIHLRHAAEYAAENYWPMNDKSCGNYGGCPFRELCAKGPETRDQWLKGLTVPRKWDPLEVRGDI